jgi:hypothetical protein
MVSSQCHVLWNGALSYASVIVERRSCLSARTIIAMIFCYYVQAVDALERRLHQLRGLPILQRRGRCLRLITGKGLHSSDGETTIAPAIERYLNRYAGSYGCHFVQKGGSYLVSSSNAYQNTSFRQDRVQKGAACSQ